MDTLETSDLVDGLIRIGETLGSSDSIDRQMNTLCRAVTSILKCDRSSIMLWDGKYFYGKYAYGHEPEVADLIPLFRSRPGTSRLQKAIRDGTCLFIPNATSDPATSKIAELGRMRAVVIAPVIHPDGSPLALMTAEYNNDITTLNETGEQLILGAAQMAQMALLAERERVIRIRTAASRRELVGELTQAEDAERSRISREIHDDSMQRVLALRLKLSALANTTDDPATKRALEQLAEQGASTAGSLRNLLQNLHPRGLENDGLAVAVEDALTRAAVGPGWNFTVENELEVEPTSEVRTVLYRAALVAFTSIETQANATQVEVRLRTVERGTEMLISNDGLGFDPAAIGSEESTLASMRKRVEHTGGILEIDSAPDAGTVMKIWIPLQIVDRSRHR